MATTLNIPLIVIVGPTASGKTGLAIKLAKEFGGEVISADSRAVYRYMDIGTAKPSEDERDGVPHWGIDLVEPGETFTAADFKSYAEQKIEEIKARGHVPFLVGGTGLYVDGVLLNYSFSQRDEAAREKFETMTLEQLHNYCIDNNISLPENDKNKRYVVNAILRNGALPQMTNVPRSDAVVVGITTDRETLRTKINHRVNDMFEQGVVAEADMLGKKFGWDSEAMSANVYQYIRQYQDGTITLDIAIERTKLGDYHLAKRQLTWFKRRNFIQWMSLDGAYTMLTQILAHLNNS
jgi:tRNA dimethylallyltransferase